MIEFGLFSSQLPYILFIAVYLLYFGASSLNHHTRDDSTQNSIVSEHHIRVVNGNERKTLICTITSSVKSVAEKFAGHIDKVPLNSISIICFPRGKILSSNHFFGNSIFSRRLPLHP